MNSIRELRFEDYMEGRRRKQRKKIIARFCTIWAKLPIETSNSSLARKFTN